MSEDVMLREAVEAISLGQRTRARDLLTRLLRADQDNANYWIWMSAAVDTTSERIYCLESALKLDPFNSTAIRGLVLLGARPAEEDIKAGPPVRRKWGSAFEAPDAPRNLLVRVYENPVLRVLAFTGLAVILISLVLVGVFGVRAFIQSEPLAIVRVTLPTEARTGPSSTPTATKTPVVRSPTPTFVGPTPLKLMLSVTYTPAPAYINTPHPIIEAYSAGLRAYYREDYPTMLNYMLQAAQSAPQAPDLHYYVGEAYRLIGEYDRALEAYDQSIAVNERFAPAYIGRSRILLLTNPAAEVEEDFQTASEMDPNLVDTYLVRASYWLEKGEVESALEDLAIVETLFPDLPLLYVYRAQAFLDLGKNKEALQDAQRAHDMDFTSLPAYRMLGQARLANGLVKDAIDALATYLIYATEDADAWLALGQAYYAQGRNYTKAVEALNQALELDDKLGEAYYYRGLVHIALEEGQEAVNDLTRALRFNANSFEFNIELGHALLVAERPLDAYGQIRNSQSLAENDAQLARVYYWRAQAQETLGNINNAIQDWQALLDLPEEALPKGYLGTAQERLRILTATDTPSVTPTPSLTLIPSPTRTPTPSRTPSKTPTKRTP